jgi:hypothetical protein
MDAFTPALANAEPESWPVLIDQLSTHYLSDPTAPNYVALGVLYTLAGLGEDKTVDYVDRTLAAVFTLINEKASALGLPAFEPPTPLEHVASTQMSQMIDYMIMSHNAGLELEAQHTADADVTRFKNLMNCIFHDAKTATVHKADDGYLNRLMDALRTAEGFDFIPPSILAGGDFDYDHMVAGLCAKAGISPSYNSEVDQLVADKLLTSPYTFLKTFDSEKINNGSDNIGKKFLTWFRMAAGRKVIDYFRTVETKRRKQVGVSAEKDPSGETYGHDLADPSAEEAFEQPLDFNRFTGDLRSYLIKVSDGHRDQDSLLRMLDAWISGKNKDQIMEAEGWSPGSYYTRLNTIRELVRNFARHRKEYAPYLRAYA